MSRIHLIIGPLLLIAAMFGCNSCDDDSGGAFLPQGEECASNGCTGIADCDNGYCNCPDASYQLSRGFCIQDASKTIFITTDQYPGLLDTMIFELDEDPWNVTWENGDSEFRKVSGRVYNRDPYIVSLGSTSSAMSVLWPGSNSVPKDTVSIHGLFDKSGNQSSYQNGEWLCRGKWFIGKFVNPDLIEGHLFINICETDGDTPRPAEMDPDYLRPVSIRRWRP